MAKKQRQELQKIKKRKEKLKPAIKIPSGWNTTDDDEIRRRYLRAATEPMKVINLHTQGESYFNTYEVQSSSAEPYAVEIRSLNERINSCSCADYNVNGLGTCKHIEKVLLLLQKKGKRKFKAEGLKGSQKTEIYMDPFDHQVKLKRPQGDVENRESYSLLKDFFSSNDTLISDAKTAVPVILRLLETTSAACRHSIRLSGSIHKLLSEEKDFTQKAEAKEFFLQDVEKGTYALDFLKLPLYDYQKQGMIHLAFLERAILADEMGLGKTVQAIAAAELLRRTRGIQKVLVIAPTSLKAEWEEQIAKFVNLPSLLIYGPREERLRHYQKESFFYLTNYEQVVRDREDIQRIIVPDLVILDEAQRIKNWRTKTAATLKQLVSPYAFVLTGTPLENRIDDIYSIVQFLYPKLFGSLFRFNREFYDLDESGKPIGYKNLDLLHRRLKPILLRRLKRDVDEQLPERTINTYFVQMSPEQSLRYADQEETVARLATLAKKRSLREEEFTKLQRALSCMRMLCDTPYILDEDCRICPKLDELETLLGELFQDEATKIIIFSEWERMLILVKEMLERRNIQVAWHTGSVDQKKRREEIHRFKENQACRVLLSTDCGAVGLNLQAANVVVNLDLPWNPAKLEQRIARAWRKHQERTVQVINLVSEHTIEHRMMGVLNLKQRLAESVLDLGDVGEMHIPSGRKAFMDQLGKIMGDSFWNSSKVPDAKETTVDPLTLFQQEALARFKSRLHQLEAYENEEGHQTVFAVIEGDLAHPQEQMHKMLEASNTPTSLRLEVLDRATFETIQRLCKAGILSFNQTQVKSFYQSQKTGISKQEEQETRLRLAQKYKEQFERKERMAFLLVEGGFPEEALSPLKDVFEGVLKSFAALKGHKIDDSQEVPLEMIQQTLMSQKGLPNGAIEIALNVRKDIESLNKNKILQIAQSIQAISQFLDNEISKFSLEYAA